MFIVAPNIHCDFCNIRYVKLVQLDPIDDERFSWKSLPATVIEFNRIGTLWTPNFTIKSCINFNHFQSQVYKYHDWFFSVIYLIHLCVSWFPRYVLYRCVRNYSDDHHHQAVSAGACSNLVPVCRLWCGRSPSGGDDTILWHMSACSQWLVTWILYAIYETFNYCRSTSLMNYYIIIASGNPMDSLWKWHLW